MPRKTPKSTVTKKTPHGRKLRADIAHFAKKSRRGGFKPMKTKITRGLTGDQIISKLSRRK